MQLSPMNQNYSKKTPNFKINQSNRKKFTIYILVQSYYTYTVYLAIPKLKLT